MRKKIGKRIGPVPITLAVVALAAVLSVGLLLAANASIIQAQGMPGGGDTSSDSKCAAVVAGDSKLLATDSDVQDNSLEDVVSGGGCKVTGDSVDVVFENHFPSASNGVPTTNNPVEVSLAAYATGGVQFPSVQAIDKNDDGDAFIVVGKVGVDEYLLAIDAPSIAIGGSPTPGTKSVTITRDMAEDGKVYLFAYIATDNAFGVPSQDNEGGTQVTTALGIPLSTFVDDNKRNADHAAAAQNEAIAFVISEINDALREARGDTNLQTAAAVENGAATQTFNTTNLPDVVAADASATPARTVADVLEDASDRIDTVTGHANYAKAGNATKIAIVDAELAILMAQAGLDAIDHGAPQHFMNTTANIVVLVEFQDPAVEKVGDKTVSYVTPGPIAAAGTSEVSVMVRDTNEIALNGFIDLVIDPSAASSVVFSQSNLKTYHAPVKDGMVAAATIKGLPKTGPVRVVVTGTFGDLTITGYAKREGAADSVTAMTYSCTKKIEGDDVAEAAICNAEAGMKTADLTESTVFAPGAKFLIVGELADSAGNTLDKRVSAKQLKPSGVTQAITSIVNAQESKTAPVVGEAQANARLIATIDTNEDRAALGNYDIEVSSSGKKMTVTITIAGDASQITIYGPDMISPATGLASYMVTATDVNGNVPADAGELDGKFTVAVRYKDAEVLGLADGKIDFNSKGVGEFLVQMPQDAVEGDSVSITVVYGSISVTKVVTYGDPPTEPEMPTELTAPSGVVVSSLATTQSISVSWDTTSIQNAQQIKVVLFNSDVTGIAKPLITINPANDPGSATFNDVPDGMYNVVVASFRTGEPHKLSDLEEVTVE